MDPDAPCVSPTIEVSPGETVRLTLDNRLPPDTTCRDVGGSANPPNCFDGTTMHAHGLWVNPAGNGDNVLISVAPGVSFQYEYNVPPDHPAGTFWYHPHRHGSTALQVSSGMAGALVVRGDRAPQGRANGDLDVLLRPIEGQAFSERILVFQQIQYACRGAQGRIKTRTDTQGRIVGRVCDPGDVGGIEACDQSGPGTWDQSGRFASINGVVQPLPTEARAGEVERWRMLHAGMRDTIAFSIRRLTVPIEGVAARLATLAVAGNDAFVRANCAGAPLVLHVVAADGLTTARAAPTRVASFQPGYRWDALVTFPEAGDYCVVDELASARGSVLGGAPGRRLLGLVRTAAGEAVPADTTAHLREVLERAARRNIGADAQAEVVPDLRDGLRLRRFVPHADVRDDEVTGTQTLTFNINVSQNAGNGNAFFEMDGRPYLPGRIDRTLILGSADEWRLTSDFVSHPFHIHVNPFQIVRIESPRAARAGGGEARRVDVAGTAEPDDFQVTADNAVARVGPADPQYAGLIGVWKDTLFVEGLLPLAPQVPVPPGARLEDYRYVVTIRTRYRRYIGDFVLHCHILDREDQRMMQNIRIALPDGRGGGSHGHH